MPSRVVDWFLGVTLVTLVILEAPNVAVSAAPLGTVVGVQLVAVFQSLLAGFKFQVALAAEQKGEARRKRARRSASGFTWAFF